MTARLPTARQMFTEKNSQRVFLFLEENPPQLEDSHFRFLLHVRQRNQAGETHAMRYGFPLLESYINLQHSGLQKRSLFWYQS